MEISTKLALRFLKKNKKRTIATIVGITIVTALIMGILLLFQAYQDYMIELIRKEENWEARFNNIPYEKVYGLTKHTDIQEVSLARDIGESEVIEKGLASEEYIYLKAYDETAMKNLGVSILEGRLPTKEGEIVVSQNLVIDSESVISMMGDTIKLTINNQEKEYKIVGIIKPPKFEEFAFNVQKIGAITYLDKTSLQKDIKVEASVKYKSLNGIYSKTEEIIQMLQLKEKTIEYNINLLHYSGIWNMTEEEDLKIIGIMLFFIILIIIIAITFIYSIFNISVLERKREFANLHSLGATKGQIFGIIIKEGTILLIISILLSIIISLFLSKGIVEYINHNITIRS